MPTHYVYEEPNPSELNQGDILRRSDALVALLTEYFPYYATHRDYIYFMVLTQTCDLVRRDGNPCASLYISLAAVKPIKDVVLAEAARNQQPALQGTNVIGNKARNQLAMFLESLMDNNKAGLFYLHTDHGLTISEPCCAILQLSISLQARHYNICLSAKIAQLKEPFQAKLGWLIGNMYSRVATTEWNIEKPAEKVGKVASKLLNGIVDNLDDEQIKVALAELQDGGKIEGMTPDQVAAFVKKKELEPKLKQFKNRAGEVLKTLKIFDPVKSKVIDALRQDDGLKKALLTLFPAQSGFDQQAASEQAVRIVIDKIRASLNDDAADEDRDVFLKGLASDLMADNVLKSLIKP
jgi:hypothetical protein